MPPEVADSFTADQREHLSDALARQGWGRHKIDVRVSFPLWKKRYYAVLLGGYDKRALTRSERRLNRGMLALLLTTLLCCCVLTGLLLLYILKSALGIDVFPDFSLGLWHSITQ